MKLGFRDETILNNGRDFYVARVARGVIVIAWYLDDNLMSAAFYYLGEGCRLNMDNLRGIKAFEEYENYTYLKADCLLQLQGLIFNFQQTHFPEEIAVNEQA